jgi:hypothetical protein
MGCDGGTIPKRDELVRTKKKKTKVKLLIYFSRSCLKEIQYFRHTSGRNKNFTY